MKTITYRAVNQTNGKWYVGSTTKTLEERKKGHLDPRIKDEFHNTLRKHPDWFCWEILSEVDGKDRSHEQEILDVWVGTDFCYNQSLNASGGFVAYEYSRKGGLSAWNSLTEEEKLEQSNKCRELANRIHSEKDEDGKSVFAKNTLGKFYTNPEHQKKASAASHKEKDKWGRSKQSVQGIGRNSKTWVLTNLETGEVFGPFPSARVASKETGLEWYTIRNRANTGKPTEGYIITSY